MAKSHTQFHHLTDVIANEDAAKTQLSSSSELVQRKMLLSIPLCSERQKLLSRELVSNHLT